ncbi:ABC transporter ATP-binding protein [Phaeobacter gallaeciensis]|uniref:ABC transporter ATP-binding protein n=1 Tax=Phaeobacter gallaeciensis TaxID=60890 RepID=UPI00237F0385|nr:ABC transporter ATP-binding protein [Phaeobacter gallaeciensis]MDE4192717.1 ABC transporter ATP-binding protein [Phaeobacter gallaeciensis]MDE4201186.1 ABC transporter ATP-binding protein [Phaeobacter gallaeciensis]MDE4205333.1 ABC transporter ATP-binding protein [Phaeobacter gallaeciensis]MDE4209509.1 ABC transporter ATP-binding protein [Phaeobacter gallaeciensis]MDE4217840.1 ABC transporter ATP-binding protein [Phaeobacter gallaeciensis]
MVLKITDVSKSYTSGQAVTPVLQGVSLTLEAGSSLALTGDSGSGKSTLLHLAAALDSFDSGEITIEGTPLSALNEAARAALRQRQVSIVFQQFNLIPSLSVGSNLSLHARLGRRRDRIWEDRLIDRLGLSNLLDRYPDQLSGGQQQRVAIGRAMALRPALLLADEPTGNLDETASEAVMGLMLELLRDSGAALFLVTHSDSIANQLDRRLHLKQGQIA